jgi:hypothetical protein
VNDELERSRRKGAALCHILFRKYPEETAPLLTKRARDLDSKSAPRAGVTWNE